MYECDTRWRRWRRVGRSDNVKMFCFHQHHRYKLRVEWNDVLCFTTTNDTLVLWRKHVDDMKGVWRTWSGRATTLLKFSSHCSWLGKRKCRHHMCGCCYKWKIQKYWGTFSMLWLGTENIRNGKNSRKYENLCVKKICERK